MLALSEWKNVLRNLSEEGEEVEVMWLESTNEYVLCHECELFEDGFNTEAEAEARLEDIYKQLEDSEEFKAYNNASYDRYNDMMKEAGHRQSDFI
ncbi:hypothetical protein Blue_021 [Bacillus phage Deep Blue]|uniref:Uncharacterized protein n=1 Tax=Bacillus phage Deep Blue TaxID=1792245 RepID=A0A140HLI2_9CAUD|nr:hypothetical protein Blue_021 [Bacillus phage Deep Blue]AMO25844.1 hypothetical protein Blue_021 [Bacillus phage Deep Blue]